MEAHISSKAGSHTVLLLLISGLPQTIVKGVQVIHEKGKGKLGLLLTKKRKTTNPPNSGWKIISMISLHPTPTDH